MLNKAHILTIWIATIVIIFIVTYIPQIPRTLAPNEYSTEATVISKDKTKGLFGSEKHFIKIKDDRNSQITVRVTDQEYVSSDEGQTLYLILNSRKDTANELFTSKEEFDQYLKDRNIKNITPITHNE